jgi:hypothetical protein
MPCLHHDRDMRRAGLLGVSGAMPAGLGAGVAAHGAAHANPGKRAALNSRSSLKQYVPMCAVPMPSAGGDLPPAGEVDIVYETNLEDYVAPAHQGMKGNSAVILCSDQLVICFLPTP